MRFDIGDYVERDGTPSQSFLGVVLRVAQASGMVTVTTEDGEARKCHRSTLRYLGASHKIPAPWELMVDNARKAANA